MTDGIPNWPNIRNPYNITEEDHSAHTTQRGIRVEDNRKMVGKLLKIAKKPHLKASKHVRRKKRK